MALYTITDNNNTKTAGSFSEAVEIIQGWYEDFASWSTGSATAEQNEVVEDAIDSVDEPEFGDSLQAYASSICEAIAKAYGGKAFAGHGNYSVSAADQMGLTLLVKEASAHIDDGVYFLHPEGSDWIALRFRNQKIVGQSCGADLGTHNAANDDWSEIEPSDSDEECESDEIASTIIRKYAAYWGRDIREDCISVSAWKDRKSIEIEITFHDSNPASNSGSVFSSITIEVDSWNEAEAAVQAELLSQSAGLAADMGHSVGDTIWATWQDEDGCYREIQHTLTASDLGVQV